jgi:hypothetical protein
MCGIELEGFFYSKVQRTLSKIKTLHKIKTSTVIDIFVLFLVQTFSPDLKKLSNYCNWIELSSTSEAWFKVGHHFSRIFILSNSHSPIIMRKQQKTADWRPWK